MKPYEYRTKNQSFLSEGFIKYVAEPLANAMPGNIPANLISVTGHISLYVALLLSFYPILNPPVNILFISLLIIIQLMCDKLDGLVARKTDTDSPLGEFIDHFFELLNQGALILIIFNLYSLRDSPLVVILMAGVCLVNMSKYYEQYKTNLLLIRRVSFFEIKIVTVVILLLSCNGVVHGFMNEPDISGFSLIQVLLGILVAGNLIVFISNMIRIPHTTYGLWLFVILLITVAVLSSISYNVIAALCIILFYSVLYVGRLLFTQLVDGLERSPDLFIPIFILIHFFTGYFNESNTVLIILLYLTVNIVLVIIKTFRALGIFWNWTNESQNITNRPE